MEKVTFVIPSRNNLDLLKTAYKSIRLLFGKHEILVLDDASIDGTGEWLKNLNDSDLIVHTNPGPERIGIVGMFDKGIEMANTDIIFAFHADMVAGSNLDTNILKHLERGTVVCATRIEPPLHPEGPEKIIHNFGIEPEEFVWDDWFYNNKSFEEDRTTEGIFAPWCMYKDDFLAVGGHDELFAPQSREDSDLFNRFVLKGYKLIQSWDALVYHFTSRGSRFNKYAGGATGKDSVEWQKTNHKNMRNFIRKWGTMVRHDSQMKPIVAPKYDIGLVVKNCDYGTLYELEPWCSTIYVSPEHIAGYIGMEQDNTLFNLKDRVKYTSDEVTNDVVVEFDVKELTPEQFQYIAQLPDILKDSGEVGEMQLGIFKITINKLETYEGELV
jgi:GT2 family glycosyltransferase